MALLALIAQCNNTIITVLGLAFLLRGGGCALGCSFSIHAAKYLDPGCRAGGYEVNRGQDIID